MRGNHQARCAGLPPAATSFANKNLTTRNNITNLLIMKPDYGKAIPEQWLDMAKVFVALGDEHRQRILLLFERGERLNVGQIAAVSTLTRSAVSHHLKVLKDAGVLKNEKVGKEVYFWINRPFVEDTLGNVLDYIRSET